jgi:hypothetical protein
MISSPKNTRALVFKERPGMPVAMKILIPMSYGKQLEKETTVSLFNEGSSVF